MGQFDGEDEDAQELLSLQSRAKNLSTERLELEIADFLTSSTFFRSRLIMILAVTHQSN